MTDQKLDPQLHVHELGQRARKAARGLLTASTEAKNTALTEAAKALRASMAELLEANAKDVESVRGKKPDSFIDRLANCPIPSAASSRSSIAPTASRSSASRYPSASSA